LLRPPLAGEGNKTDDRTSPQYLGAFLKIEIENWAAPIKASSVSVDRV
jgi:hypothetical protein